ncbi:hypothetical protein [Gelatiniphilus marinus]|uniref:Uncharacterized protein n=1 Tax=Gelatiniphilus marinus TaxID=1759464 RepID=A0ABW5JTR7_9FLAO
MRLDTPKNISKAKGLKENNLLIIIIIIFNLIAANIYILPNETTANRRNFAIRYSIYKKKRILPIFFQNKLPTIVFFFKAIPRIKLFKKPNGKYYFAAAETKEKNHENICTP